MWWSVFFLYEPLCTCTKIERKIFVRKIFCLYSVIIAACIKSLKIYTKIIKEFEHSACKKYIRMKFISFKNLLPSTCLNCENLWHFKSDNSKIQKLARHLNQILPNHFANSGTFLCEGFFCRQPYIIATTFTHFYPNLVRVGFHSFVWKIVIDFFET